MDLAAIIASVAAPCIAVLTLLIKREREHAREKAAVGDKRVTEARAYAEAEARSAERYRADNAALRELTRELSLIITTGGKE